MEARANLVNPQVGREVLEAAVADDTRNDATLERAPEQLRGGVHVRTTAEAAEDALQAAEQPRRCIRG